MSGVFAKALMSEAKKRYSGCLGVTDDGRVLMARRSFGEKRVTNVGGGTVEEKEDSIKAAGREFEEETFGQVAFKLTLPCQTYERNGAKVHSTLYECKIGQVNLDQLNATAAENLAKLGKLKQDPSATPIAVEKCKRYTEFEAFFLVPLDKLKTAAFIHYEMSNKGTQPAQPIYLDNVGKLEPAFCCLLANAVAKC